MLAMSPLQMLDQGITETTLKWIIEDNEDHESNKSLNIKKSNWFLTTDEYENVQDETEIANEATEHQNSEAYLENEFKKQLCTILLCPGSIFLPGRTLFSPAKSGRSSPNW